MRAKFAHHFICAGALFISSQSGQVFAEHVDIAPIPDEILNAVVHQPLSAKAALLLQTDHAIRQMREQLNSYLKPSAIPRRENDRAMESARSELKAHQATFFAIQKDLQATPLGEKSRKALSREFLELDQILRDATESDNPKKVRAGLKKVVARLDHYIDANIDITAETATPSMPTITPGPVYKYQRPESAQEIPEYARSTPHEQGTLVAGLTMPLLAQAAPTTPSQASACTYTSGDLATTTQEETNLTKYPEVTALAAELEYNPTKIFEYVANNIRFEPNYAGSLKGAGLTLQSKAGNDLDQASLLIALLRASKVPARYVYGEVELTDSVPKGKESRVNRWFGTLDYPATLRLLRVMSINRAELVSNVDGAAVGVRFMHHWVQACLPYAAYRGSRIDNTGHRWMALDPSYKDISYREGIAHSIKFDSAAYLNKRLNGPDSLPHEFYAEQIEAGIRELSTLNSIDRAVRTPVPTTKRFDILPATLPYKVVRFIELGPGTGKAESAAIPDVWRNRLSLIVRDPAGTTQLVSKELILSETLPKRVTLSFKGIDTAHQARLDSWRNNPDLASSEPTCTGTTPTRVRPSIKVEGTEVAVGAASPGVSFCATNVKLEMHVSLPVASCERNGAITSQGCVNTASFNNIVAGNMYSMVFWGHAGSDEMIQSRVARLLSSIKLAGTNPNDAVDIDPVQGEFLHIVGLKFGRYITDSTRRIAELAGKTSAVGLHLGLTSVRSKIGFMFDQPFAIHRKGFLIDVPSGQTGVIDSVHGTTAYDEFFLAGQTLSAYESYVWQESARLDAVSTVRGLQFANESRGTSSDNSVLRIDRNNWDTERLKLEYSPAKIEELRQIVFDDEGVLQIPKRSIIYDATWQGMVYVAESSLKSYGRYIIGEGANGGYANNTPVSHKYNPTIGTGYNFSKSVVTPTYSASYEQAEAPAAINSSVGLGAAKGNTFLGDPVNMVTGNMYHNETDFDLTLRGVQRMVFQRAYNSGRSPSDGPFGFGWTHSLNHYLTFVDENFNGTVEAGDSNGLTSGVVWTDGSGGEKQIDVTAATASGVALSSTAFSSPVGFRFVMRRTSNGTYKVTEKDGLTYTFESIAGTVGQKAALIEIADRNGNKLSLTYETPSGGQSRLLRVSDGTKELVFGYASTTTIRIQSVTDWTGRRYQYEYDAAGDLRKMWKPGVPTESTPSMSYDYFVTSDGANFVHRMKRFTPSASGAMEFEYYTNGRTLRHRDANGHAVSFSYNEFRRESVAVNERGHERRMFFDKNGMLLKQVEENDATREFVYGNADGSERFNLKEAVDPRGNRTTYQYDAADNLVQISYPSGRTEIRSHFTTWGQPGKIKDVRGIFTLLKYDAVGNPFQTIRLKSGYGASTDPATYVPVAGEIAAWSISTFDPANGNTLSVKQVRDFATQTGPSIEYGYDDGLHYVDSITRRGDKNGDGVIAADEFDSAALTVDALGRVLVGVDDRWEAISANYDVQNRIKSVTDATGSKVEIEYDTDGRPMVEKLSTTVAGTLKQWRTTQRRYDAVGRMVQSMATGGAIAKFDYDPAGNLIRREDPDGRSVSYRYDEVQRVVAVTDAEGNEASTELDVDGRPLSVTDANGLTTRYEYWDSSRDGRLRRILAPQVAGFGSGVATEYDYDEAGNAILVRQVGANGTARTMLTTFDELNRAVRVAGPAVNDPVYGLIRPVQVNRYDALGRLLEVKAGRTDASGSSASSDVVTTQAKYVFDDFGRLLREEDGAARAWTYTYDRAGNVLTSTDPRGKVTTFEWQSGGRLHRRSNDAGLTTYVRDGLGAPLKVTGTSPVYAYEYEYDAFHRLISVQDSRGGKDIRYEYTRAGLLSAMRTNEGAETNYQYDPSGRLVGIWAPNYDYFAFGYDRGGRLTEKWSPEGSTSRWRYNDDGTLSELSHSGGGAELANYQYVYDEWGNRKSSISVQGTSTLNSLYEYDEMDRLVRDKQIVAGAVPNTLRDERYRYDIYGNRTRETFSNGSYNQYRYDTGGRHQLTSITAHHVSGVQLFVRKSYEYDTSGNRTRETELGGIVREYDWDADNSLRHDLLSIPGAGIAINEWYDYDAEGRRIESRWHAVTPSNSSEGTSRFVYSGEDIVAEYGIGWEEPVSGYTHGPGRDNPLLMQGAAGDRYFHADGLGSIVLLTDVA
ncbi:MAG: DUF6531 domain-containing protein, partial [Pseudomonadota bacterium]